MKEKIVPGAVLFFAGAFVFYALRGPVDFPRSPLGAVLALVAIPVLGHLAALAALAVSWGVLQVWAADLFQEHAPLELIDELAPRGLGPEVRARVAAGARAAFGLELPTIARADDEARRDEKARALDEIFALARARASALAPLHLEALEGRVDGARGLAASLLLSALLVLGTAFHDFSFAHKIAHAFSSFSIVVLGVALAFSSLAAIGRARSQARRLALDVLLLLAQGGLTEVGKEARHADAARPFST